MSGRCGGLEANNNDCLAAGNRGGEKATNLEEECTSETRPDKEKVWCVWYVARRVHITQPQIKQGQRGIHALCTDN